MVTYEYDGQDIQTGRASSLRSAKMQSGKNEKLCLQWNNFRDNIQASFEELREDKDFTDVTLFCEDGQQVESHKMVLMASSPFFSNLLRKNKHTHPLIYMRGVNSDVLMAMADFFYRGEANVYQENLDSFLALAAELQLRGLEENQNKENANDTNPMKTVKDNSPRVKPNPNAYSQEVLTNDDRNCGDSEPSRETVIALSDQANSTDLDNLNETVKSMMILSENRYGKEHWRERICKACGKEGSNSTITNHIESVHLSGLQIPCNICGKTFKSRHQLTVHKLKNHRNEKKKTKCWNCDEVFTPEHQCNS